MLRRHRSTRIPRRRFGRSWRRRRTLLMEPLESRELLAVAVWHNLLEPANVNGDALEAVSPIDALTVIEELVNPRYQDPATGELPKEIPDNVLPPPYVDVSCDGIVSPLDALIVVDRLVNGPAGPLHPRGGRFATEACSPQLSERSGIRNGLSQALVLPNTTSAIEVSFRAPQFDTTSQRTMQDAFEIELLDKNGQPLALPFAPGHDAVFNWSESASPAQGPATIVTRSGPGEDWTVTTSLNGLPAGTEVEARLRLVNNDRDDGTRILVRGFQVVDAPTEPPSGMTGSSEPERSAAPIMMEELIDLSSAFPASFSRSTLDGDDDVVATELTVTNESNTTVQGQLIVAIDGISDAATHVLRPDGFLPDGRPYLDLSSQIPEGRFQPGQSIASRHLEFLHDSDERFDFRLSTYGRINQSPASFTSVPTGTIEAGRTFRYHAQAVDPDGDSLSYSLTVGPKDASLDPQTGDLVWPTLPEDVGTHQFTVRARDPYGLTSEQTFSLRVEASLQNRPPVFVTTPETEAIAGSGWEVSTAASGAGPLAVAIADVGSDKNTLVTINGDSETLSRIDAMPNDHYADAVELLIGEPPSTGDPLRSGYNVDVGLPLRGHPSDRNRIDGFDQGDINGDGFLDFVVNRFVFTRATREVQQSVAVVYGDGNGGFTVGDAWSVPPPSDDHTSDYTNLAVADFTNDDWDDVLTLNRRANQLLFFENDGAGNLKAPQTIDLATPIFDFKVTDLDRDGTRDLLAILKTNRSIGYMLGRGDGTFEDLQTVFTDSVYLDAYGISSGRPYDAGDLDGDGNMDIAVAVNGRKRVVILLGDENLHFTEATQLSIVAAGRHGSTVNGTMVDIADLNGDGNNDVLIGTESGRVRRAGGAIVYLGDGSGSNFTLLDAVPVTTFAPANWSGTAEPVDLDGDGDLDVVVGSDKPAQLGYQASVWINRGDGTFENRGLTTPFVRHRFGDPGDTEAMGRAVTAGDYNSDGLLDLAVVRSSYSYGHDDSSVSILPAIRPGVFSSGYTTTFSLPVNSSNTFFEAGDFNNDGYVDIWSPGYQSVSRTWFGDGSGTFSDDHFVVATPYIGNEGLRKGFTSDLDHDGNLDIVWLGTNGIQGGPGPRVLVGMGNGDGTFHITFAQGGVGTIGIVRPGDFNGDGFTDIATRSHGPQVDVWLYDPDQRGTFVRTTTFPLNGVGTNVNGWFTALAVDDFDGDGHLDMATVDREDSTSGRLTLLTWYGRGDGTFDPVVEDFAFEGNPSYATPYFADAGDFNGDGFADLATYAPGIVSVHISNGDRTFARPIYYSAAATSREFLGLYVLDFDGDGRHDILFNDASGTDRITFLRGRGDGTFEPRRSYDVGFTASDLTFGDFNHDSQLDLLAGNRSFVPVYTIFQGRQPGLQDLVVVDVNQDGNDDLFAVHTDRSRIKWFLGDHRGEFSRQPDLLTGTGPVSIGAADFDSDGRDELFTVNGGGRSVSLFHQTAENVWERSDNSVGGHPVDGAASDVTGDGLPDLLVLDDDRNALWVLAGKGDFSFETPLPAPLGDQPNDLFAADANGDGKIDAIITLPHSQRVMILPGDGTGGFDAPSYLNLSGTPSDIVAVDFNDDGHTDIAVSLQDTNEVAVFFGRGSGQFTVPQRIRVGQAPSAVALGDADDDGRTDLLVANAGDDTVSVLFNRFDPTRIYAYRAEAIDPDDDPVTFRLVDGPGGMILDSSSGQVMWAPSADQVGQHSVTIEADDGRGGKAKQIYRINVRTSSDNHPPLIANILPSIVTADHVLDHTIAARDSDGNPLRYELSEGPDDAVIDPTRGSLSWSGTSDGAIQLSSADDNFQQIVVPHTDSLVLRDVTLESWVAFDNVQPNTVQYLVSKGNNGNVTYGLAYVSGQLQAIIGNQGISAVRFGVPFAPKADRWYHLAMVFDSRLGEVRLYVNGAQVGSFSTSAPMVDDGGSLQIGPPNSNVGRTDARFDNTRIWNVARTAEEIREGMNRHYPGDPALVLDFRYEFGESQTVRDHSIYGNDGLRTGTTWPELVSGLAVASNGAFRVAVDDGRGGRAEQSFDVTFVPPLRGSIAGTVFADANGDGVRQTDERLLSDWVVYADTNDNAFPDPREPRATTDGSGRYVLDGLLPGDYRVRVEERAGFRTPSPVASTVQANLQTTVDWAVVERGRGQIRGRVVTEHAQAAARQQIFADLDRDGRWDTHEPAAWTDALGDFALTDLPAGQYDVRLTRPAGWNVTEPVDGFQRVMLDGDAVVTGTDFTLASNSASAESGLAFVTTPPSTDEGQVVSAGNVYRYFALAENWTGAAVEYSVSEAPDGLSIDPSTGLVAWRPELDQLGSHSIILRASDADGSVALQTFTLTVVAPNTVPVITSVPPDSAYVDLAFVYPVAAQDAESRSLEFRLTEGPTGATIDIETGVLRWTPHAPDIGPVSFIVSVADEEGRTVSQSFTVEVKDAPSSTTPFAIAPLRTTAAAGEEYRTRVFVTDAGGRPLPVTLESGPLGMQLGTDGILRWTPSVRDIGEVHVVLSAEDEVGNRQQFPFNVTVSRHLENRTPHVVSEPPRFAVADQPYVYDLVVEDDDNGTLSFELVDAPPGMSIDPVRGRVRWQPPATLIGRHHVKVRVVDAYGAEAEQSFVLRVRRAGGPPVISSTPPTEAYVGTTWRYPLSTEDPERDPVTYQLLQAPQGMTVEATTGEMVWTPAPDQTGLQFVAVQVIDGLGGATTQSFSVRVHDGVPNQPPTITTTPNRFSAVGSLYRYQVRAEDPEGTLITYALARAPQGLAIDETTGRLEWMPTPADAGRHVVTIVASDAGGAAAVQSFELDVLPANSPPQFESIPPTDVFAGETFRYLAVAKDPDLDPVTYEVADGPEGMTIDAFGMVSWETDAADIGSHLVTLRAFDARGGSDEQGFLIQVREDTVPPNVVVNGSGFRLPWNGPLSFFVSATDNVGVEALEVTVDGQPFALPSDGMGYLDYATWGLGVHNIVATARDAAGNVGQATGAVAFCDPCGDVGGTDGGGVDHPLATITNPADTATVTGMVSLVGTANIDGFDHYRLLYRRVDEEAFTEFHRSSTAVVDGELGIWDTSLLENDEYVIRLEVTDTFGRVAVDDVRVGLSGALKLGDFRLSFTDLTVPVSGIPIQVVRSYDSLRADRKGDFGYGWRLEFRDTDLQVGLPESGLEHIGVFTPMRPGVKVYMTLPGQVRVGWTFTPQFRVLPGLGDHLVVATPRFTPDPGNTAQLIVDSGQLFANERGELFAAGKIPWNPAAPDFGGGYTVVTRDGIRYHVDGESGQMDTVSDRNGNTLTFSESGIRTTDGVAVAIERDRQGRITSITDPMGRSLQYAYSVEGDLVQVMDREGNATTIRYVEDRPHYVQSIVDPTGRVILEGTYGEDGRLTHVADGAGNTTTLQYQPGDSVVKTTDPLGATQTTVYDNRGNVVARVDALGNTTTFEYDDKNRLVARTSPLGHITRYTYDSAGRRTAMIDPLGFERRRTFDESGNLVSETDALGRTTRYQYDERGNRTAVIAPNGARTSARFDDKGRVLATLDPLGAETTYTYDARNLTSVTQPTGRTVNFAYDANGTIRHETSEYPTRMGNVSLQIGYEANGNDELTRIVAAGIESTRDFDAAGRVANIVRGDGTRQSLTYDEAGRAAGFTFRSNSVSLQYDAAGRTTMLATASGDPLQFSYDATGQLTGLSTADGRAATTVYDADGRIVANTITGGSEVVAERDAAGRVTKITINGTRTYEPRYDAEGRLVELRRDGVVLERTEYHDVGQPSRIVFADGSEERFEYDLAGNKTAFTDRSGNTWRYEYEPSGALSAVIDPAGGRTELTIDPAGNWDTVTDALGRQIVVGYDALGRRTKRRFADGTEETTTFDDRGRVSASTLADGSTIAFSYDAQNRLLEIRRDELVVERHTYVSDTAKNVDGVYGKTSIQTSGNGLPTRWTDPAGTSVTTTWSAGSVVRVATPLTEVAFGRSSGRIARITEQPHSIAAVTTIDSTPEGLPVAVHYPDQSKLAREFDNEDKLTSMQWSASDGTILFSQEYSRFAGRIAGITRSDGVSLTYAYDPLGRLLGETRTSSDGTTTTSYEYDSVGNRIAMTRHGARTTYAYDERDRILSAGARQFEFDALGRMVREQEGSETVSYEYDALGRLHRWSRVDGATSTTVTYTYDFDGLLLTREQDGVITRYVWDRYSGALPMLLETRDGDGNLLERFVHDGVRYLYSVDATGNRTLFASDHVGSIVALIDEPSQNVTVVDTDAFGVSVGADVATTIGFAGGLVDPTSGLVFLRARWYAPKLGRFLQPDAAEAVQDEPRSLHRYVYAWNDPINRVDNDGFLTISEELVNVAIQNILAAGVVAPVAVAASSNFVVKKLSGGRVTFENKTGTVRPFLDVSASLSGSAFVGVTGSLSGGLEVVDIPGYRGWYAYIGGGFSVSGGFSTRGAPAQITAAFRPSAVGDIYETWKPRDYTAWFFTITGGLQAGLRVPNLLGGSVGATKGSVVSTSWSPAVTGTRDGKPYYSHSRIVFRGGYVASSASEFAAQLTFTAGFSVTYYFDVTPIVEFPEALEQWIRHRYLLDF